MSGITTHVLDTARGKPAQGVPIRLERETRDGWALVGEGKTDDDGRLRGLADGPLKTGTWRITFDTGTYFAAHGVDGFYPFAQIAFTVANGDEHFHVPLLLNPFGFSTYRGS